MEGQQQGKYTFIQPTQDLKDVQDFIQGEEVQARQPAIPKEEIDPKEYNEDISD
jgi:hypothetical protein